MLAKDQESCVIVDFYVKLKWIFCKIVYYPAIPAHRNWNNKSFHIGRCTILAKTILCGQFHHLFSCSFVFPLQHENFYHLTCLVTFFLYIRMYVCRHIRTHAHIYGLFNIFSNFFSRLILIFFVLRLVSFCYKMFPL